MNAINLYQFYKINELIECFKNVDEYKTILSIKEFGISICINSDNDLYINLYNELDISYMKDLTNIPINDLDKISESLIGELTIEDIEKDIVQQLGCTIYPFFKNRRYILFLSSIFFLFCYYFIEFPIQY